MKGREAHDAATVCKRVVVARSLQDLVRLRDIYPAKPLWSHVVLTLLLVKLSFLLGSGVLVLLVLRDEIVHVRLGLGELHLIHALTSVPVQEGLAAEHSSEVLGDALEHLLDGSAVACECNSHLQALWRDVADAGLDVV